MKTILILFVFLVFGGTASADVFQGEITQVDSSQGNVSVRYRDAAGGMVVEKTFHLPPGQAPASIGLPTLNDVKVGDRVQVTALNQNGSWQVQSLVTNPAVAGASSVVIAGPTLPAGAVNTAATAAPTPVTTTTVPASSTNSVFVASPRVSTVTPPTVTATGPFLPPETTPPVNTSTSPFSQQTPGSAPTTTLSTGANSGAAGTPGNNGAAGSPANNGASGAGASAGS